MLRLPVVGHRADHVCPPRAAAAGRRPRPTFAMDAMDATSGEDSAETNDASRTCALAEEFVV